MNVALKIGDFVDFIEPDAGAVSVPREPSRWFLVRVHPLTERRVHAKLTERGVSCYVPLIPRRVVVARAFAWQKPIVRRVQVPLFPGLVFVPDFDVDIPRLRLLAAGVVGLLHLEERPASLRAQDVADIRAIEARLSVPLSSLKRGDLVRIRDGSPFAMWTGRIDRLDDKGRLRVLIDAIKREVAVELSSHQVEPA